MLKREHWNFTRGTLIALGVVFAGAFQTMQAATICVGTGQGCQTTIGKAVLAANPGDTIQVGAGTYKEQVTLTSGVLLLGAGSATTIIDATGLANGVVINGGTPGLSGAGVSGFSIKNANFQGILVENASNVAIWSNQVLNNNVGLNTSSASGPTCPGLTPALDAGEDMDCGEGINLAGADHSVVSNNVITGNSGGILISDDIGATHDNVITGNVVANNGYACGITMASHSGMGVYRNTVSNNQSFSNGLKAPGEGAGIGIFAAGPGAQTYSNVVINNVMTNNGLPGVAMHNHAAPMGAPAVVFNDNKIIGNTISGNGPDVEDTATSGTTGINIFSIAPITGTVVSQNTISNEKLALVFTGPGSVTATLNSFPATTGIDNVGPGTVNGSFNYWGCSTGANSTGCATIVGTGVSFGAPLPAAFSSSQLPSAPGSTSSGTGTTGGGTGVTPPGSGMVTVLVTGPAGTGSGTTFQIYSNTITLSAATSTSTNAGALSYSWTVPQGFPTPGILMGNTATPTMQFPKPGTYQFLLTVTDTTGLTGTATVTVQYI